MDMASMFAGQGWFEIAGQVVLVFTALTGALPDKFASKIPILKTVWPLMNWLAGNVFNNINHPKGMAASADVEKEIDEAKAEVRDRSGMPDVLDGL
jgi:hypothetical protein